MWLLKFHIAFSILCLLTADGFAVIFRDGIKENGWVSEKKKNIFKRIFNHWVYFIPFMNLLTVIATFMMITVKKTKWDEFSKTQEEKKDEA